MSLYSESVHVWAGHTSISKWHNLVWGLSNGNALQHTEDILNMYLMYSISLVLRKRSLCAHQLCNRLPQTLTTNEEPTDVFYQGRSQYWLSVITETNNQYLHFELQKLADCLVD